MEKDISMDYMEEVNNQKNIDENPNQEEKKPKDESREKKTKKEKEPVNPVKEIISWVIIFAVAVAIAFVVNNVIIINANVPTGSMENTIMTGDRMIGLRTSYWFHDPERGEILIFDFPDNEEETFVKRVIGEPGDVVKIRDAKIYINDSTEPLKEDYLPEEWVYENGSETELVYYVPKKGDKVTIQDGKITVNGYEMKMDQTYYEEDENNKEQYVIKEDCYFVLGDNRNLSRDARFWNNTYVKRSQVIAKAVLVYWPWKNKTILHTAEY